MKINNLISPFDISYSIRNVDVPSRFFFAPINTGLADYGIIRDEFIEFYKERSGNFVGINYIGNVAIGKNYITNQNTAYFTEDTSQWQKLIKTISDKGSIPGIQIACRNSSLTPIRKMINNDIDSYKKTVQEDLLKLSEEEILDVIQHFIDSSLKSYELGFKVIQIHAAHGYFLSQLLSNELNLRSDKYGTNRILPLKEIVEGIRAKSNDLIIDIRISYLEGLVEEDKEIAYKSKLIEELVKLDVDMISFSNGIYDVNKLLIYPIQKWGHAVFLKNIISYATKYPNILWNTAGNIWDLNSLNLNQLPNNLSFSLGRSLIADPLFIKKTIEKENDSINQCEYKNKCHYYSLNLEHIGCPIYELNKTL